jgi:hypothetical protein
MSTIDGGNARAVGSGGVKEVKYAPKSPGMYKNRKKYGFLRLLKKKTFFIYKYLTRYTPET